MLTKKRFIVVFLLLFCCVCLFANGGSEIEKAQVKQYSSAGVIAKVMQGIGDTYSSAARAIVLALHPFPNILNKFYGFIDGKYDSIYNGEFDADYMLTSSNFYTNSGYTQTDKNDITGQAQVQITGSEGKYYISETNTTDSRLQKQRWTITSYLFVIFFAAEVVFTAVFGYIAPQDENSSLLRQIGVSAAMTLMLFVLAAALPFLVEAVRYALFQIAGMYSPVAFESMFDMPRLFMYDMGGLIDTVGWAGDASPIFNGGEKKLTNGILGSIIAGLIYVVFEFVMGAQAIKAGVHILVNIIEIYLLLSVVMIMLPISVFTPLKGVSRKCVYSLLTNLIECFVLCLIIVLLLPACIGACDNLKTIQDTLNNAMANRLEIIASEKFSFSDSDSVQVDWSLYIEKTGNEDYIALVSWLETNSAGETSSSSATMYFKEDSFLYRTYKSPEYNFHYTEIKTSDYKESILPSKYKYAEKDKYYLARAKSAFWIVRCRATGVYYRGVETAIVEHRENYNKTSTNDNYQWEISEMFSRIRDYDVKKILNNSKATESDRTYSKNTTLIGGLLIAWVFLYLPCFFVMQSTQITNALSNGSAGHESFANALGHTGGQIMHGITTAANLVKSAVSMAAGAAGAGTQKGMAADSHSIQEKMQSMNDKDSGGQS